MVNQYLGNVTGNVTLIYQTSPWYMNIWFYVSLGVIVIGLGAIAWVYFQHNIKNRTNLRIHFSDKKVRTFSFKDVTSEYIEVIYGDKDKDGNKIKHKKHIVPECIEYGYFGRYLEYYPDDIEPINLQDVKNKKYEKFNIAEFTKVAEAYLNSETLQFLLLIGKLKDALLTLLYIIIGLIVLSGIAIILVQIYSQPQALCTLQANNQTISTIRMAIGR